jgi:hypothetical protein
MKKLFWIILITLIASLGFNLYFVFKLSKHQKSNEQLKSKVIALQRRIRKKASSIYSTPGGSARIRKAYSFAQENQGVLKKINCYCGCQNSSYLRHASLTDCFIKKIATGGRIIYDFHGQNCSTCVDEILDIKSWLEEQNNYAEIKNLIDKKYGPAGP